MLTGKEILREYAFCLNDPKYVIENYFKTFDKTQEGYVPFKLFPKQKIVVSSLEDYKRNLVTKPRQAGISTTVAAYCAAKIGFADKNNPETIVIVANKLRLSKKFLKSIKDFLKQVPRWAWGSEYYGSKDALSKDIFEGGNSQDNLILPNGSQVIAVATSEDALRGYTPTFLIFDEAAFIEKGSELYSAAITSLGTGGKCVLISTPNGLDDLYYKTYDNAKKGKNNYNIIEMKWYEDPRYRKGMEWIDPDDEGFKPIKEVEFTKESFEEKFKQGLKPISPWYLDMCKSMNDNPRKIAQELDVSFLGSGGNVVDDKYVTYHETNNVRPPKFVDNKYRTDESGEVWIWEEPIEGHRYILAADVSRGDGEDSSTFTIIDFETMEQVVEFEGKLQPDLLAEPVFEYATRYNAYVAVDITGGMGNATVYKLQEMGYDKIHTETRNGKDNPGFTIQKVRPQLIANLEEKIRLNNVTIRSIRLISELRTFIYKNGRPDHAKGHHDDCIMALAMALYLAEFNFKNLEKLEKKTRAMLGGWVMGTNNVNYSQKKKKDLDMTFAPRKGSGGDGSKYMWLFSKSK